MALYSVLMREIEGRAKRKDRPFVWNKPLEVDWVSPQVGRGIVSGNHLDALTCVIQVDGNSDMVATCFCMLGVGRAQKRTSSAEDVEMTP